MQPAVAVLITTTRKNGIFLGKLISLFSGQSMPAAQITIICDDNPDGERRVCVESSLPVIWIDNQKRQPLTRLINEAIFSIRQDFILLVNDDVSFGRDFMEQLLEAMKNNNTLGMASGKILRMDKYTIDSAGQFLARDRRPHDRGYGMPDQGQFETPGYVFGACGAAVLYRRKMLEDVAVNSGEYFDPDYHMFYEDLDLAWRAQRFGWKAYYNPKAIAYHVRGATSKSKKPPLKFLEKYNFAWLSSDLKANLLKNRYMTIIKNDKMSDFIPALPQMLLYDFKLWLYCLLFDQAAIISFAGKSRKIFGAFTKRRMILKKIKKRCLI